MSKKKSLTADEKGLKLLELFHETNDVYQLKDLERLAPKEKGIVLQSVKTTLQELIDNELVKSEKILGSLYYWSFPSENVKKLERQIIYVESNIVTIQQRLKAAEHKLLTHQEDEGDTTAAEVITREIEVLLKEKQELETRTKQFQNETNLEEIKTKERDTKRLMEAANRWTDNIFLMKTWCKRKFDKQDKDLNKAFGISDDLDYVNI